MFSLLKNEHLSQLFSLNLKKMRPDGFYGFG